MSYEACTVLELGGRGKLRGAAFALTGRTCVKNEGGAVWNEWTMRFDDGRVAFLAEARGSFTVFFERPIAPTEKALGDAVIGGPLDTGFIVVERGKAARVATWGDVPDVPRGYRYADLSSRTGESATLDYSTPKDPRVFVGTRVALDAIGLRPRRDRPRFVTVKRGGAFKGGAPALAIGDEAVLGKARFRVIGSLQRSIAIEGKRYSWEEHLLHDAAAGFRWLALSDGAWNLVEGVEPGLVTFDDRSATLDGVRHRFASGGTARVEWAAGEMPWDVAIGDTARVRDYASGTRSLSYEETDDEIAWSRGVLVPAEKIRIMFGKSRR
jgi:hypothetical protein